MTNMVDADRFRTKASARGTGGSDGGNMDDISRRLGTVESLVAETREDVSAIKSALAHVATKADLKELKGDVEAIKATLPHLATKADINSTGAEINSVRADINLVRAEMNLLRADVNTLETRIMRWVVGTTLAAASVAFTIAKFVK